jgi:protein-S-isoprenylcysteine O-methyltransferase Ste14
MMWRGVLRTAAATVAFGLLHSALAARPTKRAAGRLLGRRARNGLYRPAYMAQSIASTAILAAYIRRQPDRELYRARGPLALVMRGGQAAGLASLAWAALQLELGRWTGAEGLAALWAGEPEVPRESEAQGPDPDGGTMRVTGPFRHSRHPLNLAFLPVLWLQPRMTANLLTFNLVATAYLVLGSRHEEARLHAAYGPAYESYRRSGVPFYLPRMQIGPAVRPGIGTTGVRAGSREGGRDAAR